MLKKLFFLLPLLLFFQCPFITLVDDISIKVISSGGGHTGFYIADNGNVKHLEGASLINGISVYENNLGPIETLMVSATSKLGATSISIKIYQGTTLAKEKTLDNISQESTVTVNYTYGESPTPAPAP